MLDASYNKTITTTNQKYSSGLEKNVTGGTGQAWSAEVLLDWTLFDGFGMWTNKSMLEVLEKMGETDARITIENTVSSIILTYFGIVQQGKLVHVMQEAVDLSMTRKRIASAKISIGSGSKLMLLQSTVDLNADSTSLLKEQTTLKNLKSDLNRLMGRDPMVFYKMTDTLNLTNRLDYADLLAKTSSQNADLVMARHDQEISFLSLKNARSARYPDLDFLAGYTYNRLNSQSGFLEHNKAFGPNYGLTLTYNLFNGFNTNRNIKNAKLEVSSAEFSYQDSDLTIRNDLYKQYNEYLLNLDITKLETANQAVAKENVNVALEKYKLGAISDIDLREIQRKLIDSQYQLLLSQFQAKQAEIELLRMSGELFNTIAK